MRQFQRGISVTDEDCTRTSGIRSKWLALEQAQPRTCSGLRSLVVSLMRSPLATFTVQSSFRPFIEYILICLKNALKNRKKAILQPKKKNLSFSFFVFLFVWGFCCCFVRQGLTLYLCPGTHAVVRGGLQLRDLPASAPSRGLALKARVLWLAGWLPVLSTWMCFRLMFYFNYSTRI